MRIEEVSQPIRAEISKKIGAEKKAQIGTRVSKDSVNLSQEAQRLNSTEGEINAIQAQIEALPYVREEKLQEIRQKIQNGYYNSEEFIDKLADKLIRDFNLKPTL